MSVRVRYGVACARDCFSGRRASRSSNVWCNVHLAWRVFKRCSLQKTYVYRILNNSVEHTTVTKKPSGWQKYDSPSYEKLPSGTHNTKKTLLTRSVRVLGEYSVEVAGQTVNLLPLWFGWFDSIFSHWSIRGWKLGVRKRKSSSQECNTEFRMRAGLSVAKAKRFLFGSQ